jgi:tuberous sclerosis 2
MSCQQDDDAPQRRPRSSTTSFPSFPWKKPPPPTPPAQTLPLEALIEAVSPPSVPSLVHARSLANVLASYSPLPSPSVLNSVFANLCNSSAPVLLQAAGYDILSAYWENNDAPSLTTADRLAYFSLFKGSPTAWSHDLWEPRLRALRSLTKFGTETIGVEMEFLEVLKKWIQDAFEGLLLADPSVDPTHRNERERAVEVLSTFLTSATDSPEIVARPIHENCFECNNPGGINPFLTS